MSGFGGIFVAAIIGMIFIMSFSTMIQLYVNSLMLYQMERSDYKQKTNPVVDSGKINGTYTFLINVTMEGVKSIKYENLKYSDIFIVYYSDGIKIIKKFEMGTGVDKWEINRIFTGNTEGEIINPINKTIQTGMWDPGETLELMITTSSSIDENLWFFSITLMDGGTCNKTFD
jgi:hypothetical protein